LQELFSELPFLFILSVDKAQRSEGTQAWILLEMEFDEVIIIAIPEELIEFLDKVQEFPGRLDFFVIFHFFLLCLLAFKVLDFKHHLRGDGAFLVKHGVGEGLLDDGADLSGDAERDLMDRFEGMIVKDRFSCAGQFEVMSDIVFRLFGGKAGHVVTDGDPLVEGFHDGKLHEAFQIRLTAEDQDEGVVGVHFEVGEESEFFEGAGLKEMGLIDDQEDGFSRTLLGFEEGLLDLSIDSALGESGRQSEEAI
jgi:hypothetical protein